MEPSSEHLHPDHGGRFVLSRTSSEPARYTVDVYLPNRRHLKSVLTWSAQGEASLDPSLPEQWVHDETLKLARVLRRTPKPHLSRWRDGG